MQGFNLIDVIRTGSDSFGSVISLRLFILNPSPLKLHFAQSIRSHNFAALKTKQECPIYLHPNQ